MSEPVSPLDDWLARLEAPTVIELGLDRVRRVRDAAGLLPACPVITVAGTNGKGSTCATLEAVLGAAGYRTGLYTSPHLLRYNERVRIGGRDADDAALVAAFEAVEAARGDTALTYFEFGTLAAMHCFLAARVDVVILEVGLGGRLDAVNAWDADAAIVTSVDFDHMDYLGDTLDKIAYEKAGVYRAGRPAICAPVAPPASLSAHAAAIGADLRRAGRDYRAEVRGATWDFAAPEANWSGLPPPRLAGACQLGNAAAALAALAALRDRLPLDVEAVRRGLEKVALPGRYQRLYDAPETVVDVAHNPEAARALASVLAATPRRTLAIVGMLADKDVNGVLAPLLPRVEAWWTLPPDSPRALAADVLAARLAELGAARVAAMPDFAHALAAARGEAGGNDRILIFGSFFTVSAALHHAAAQP